MRAHATRGVVVSKRRCTRGTGNYAQGAMNPLEPTDLVDRIFGDRFRVVGRIGTGPHAEVCVAVDLDAGEHVALKVFDQALGEDPDLAERIIEAVDDAADIRHATLVEIIDRGIDGVRIWVASELCTGGSLGSMLGLGERLTPSQALVMSLECARVLGHVHAQGAVHQGLKPENILFSEDQRLRITDLGLASVLADAPLADANRSVDRVRYLAPEQTDDSVVTGEADLYSLALVVNEAVSGQGPAVAETAVGSAALRRTAPAELAADLGALRSPLERCGRIHPEERPEADELTIALLAAAETMSRPGPLALIGIPGLDLLDAPSPARTQVLDPGPVEVPGLDEPVEPGNLVAVPDVPDEGERVALEDLDRAEPTFADGDEADEPVEFDAPTSAAQAATSGTVFRQDAEDLDDHLPSWPLLVLGGLIALAVAAWFVLGSASGGGAVTVPNLIGAEESDVVALADENGWDINRLETRLNGSVAGSIVTQDPAAGAELDEGETLTVTVSLGSEMVEIPNDVAGLTIDQARDRLSVANLVVGAVTEENSETVDTGLVIDIDEPTRQKPAGESVALRVSVGPEARVVPDVIGTTISDATAVLAALRLQAEEQLVFDPFAEAGTVLGSLPGAGEPVDADSQVILQVSAGPEPVVIPDVTDLSLADAVDIIESFGLIFADTQGTPGEPVISTIPDIGQTVSVGTEITIVLGEPNDGDEEEPADEG